MESETMMIIMMYIKTKTMTIRITIARRLLRTIPVSKVPQSWKLKVLKFRRPLEVEPRRAVPEAAAAAFAAAGAAGAAAVAAAAPRVRPPVLRVDLRV